MQKTIEKVIAAGDKFKIIQEEAKNIYNSSSVEQCFNYSMDFYKSENCQVQELAVFILGHIASNLPKALSFLKETVSLNSDWKVQEILAMAFDCYCKAVGYEKAQSIIIEWINSDIANVKRAVTEGLRIWTSRPYFKENPSVAISMLANLKDDESEYVRKSVGNALRDISKKHIELIKDEVEQWDLFDKKIRQVYILATKFINKDNHNSYAREYLECETVGKIE